MRSAKRDWFGIHDFYVDEKVDHGLTGETKVVFNSRVCQYKNVLELMEAHNTENVILIGFEDCYSTKDEKYCTEVTSWIESRGQKGIIEVLGHLDPSHELRIYFSVFFMRPK